MKELNRSAQSGSFRAQQGQLEELQLEVQTLSAEDIEIRTVDPQNLREFLKNLRGEIVLPGVYDANTNSIRTISFTRPNS